MNNKKTQIDMMKKQKYEVPALTVVEFKVERGFADSFIPDHVEATIFGGIVVGSPIGQELAMGSEMTDLGTVTNDGGSSYFENTGNNGHGTGGGGYF